MRHQNTVFHDAIKLIPWGVFDQLVEQHGTDRLVRKFTTRHQLTALLFGQLSGATSLREIESSLESHKARLYHVGGRVPCRSTFADANRQRDASVFSGLFADMLGRANRQMRHAVKRQMGDVVRLIDSTGLRLAGVGTDLRGELGIAELDLAARVGHGLGELGRDAFGLERLEAGVDVLSLLKERDLL